MLPAPARLRIHDTRATPGRGGAIRTALRRCQSWVGQHAFDAPPAAVHLRITDLQGRPVHAADDPSDATGVVEVQLPAGTYHVTAARLGCQRRYTLTLEPGATVDLHLRGLATQA